MNNFDYIPLDQAVIDHEVEELEKRRKFKMIDVRGHLTKTAREAFEDAYIAGSDGAFVVFPNAYENASKYRRITDLLDSMRIDWNYLNEDIFISRNWIFEAVSDRSKTALTELKNLIG